MLEIRETHHVMKQDHTGRGVKQGDHPSFEMAMAHAMLGKANTKPGLLTANIWYVASLKPDMTFDVKYA